MTQFVIRMLAVISLLSAGVHGEVLFGPVVVEKGSPYSGTFGMYCRCTAYFVEARNGEGGRLSKECTVVLNGETVLDLEKGWSTASRQVELREDEPNEILIETEGEAASQVSVTVYERDVSPAPMAARQYAKKRRSIELFEEGFVLNHWATRFLLEITNGEREGGNRVNGRVVINGVEVVGRDELNKDMYRVLKEIELIDGWNEVEVYLDGGRNSYVNIGIEEAAQTVEVTEVAEVELPFFTNMGGIQVYNGEPMIRLSDLGLVQIDGQGNVQELLDGVNVHGGAEGMGVMSMRGSYVWTFAHEEGEPVSRFYDRDWNQLSEFHGERGAIQQISEAGNVFMGWDAETYSLSPCAGKMVAVYDAVGSLISKIPVSHRPSDLDTSNQLSPDGLNCWVYCNDSFQMYGTNGTYYWEAPWRRSRELANGRMAVQGTADSLIIHGSDGQVVRRLINSRPANKVGLARTTPNGQYALHKGYAVMVAKRDGPQSCWSFDPGGNARVRRTWMSEDGKWVLAISFYGSSPLPSAWLLGAGGQIAWQTSDLDLAWGHKTMLTQHGEYFYLLEEMEGYNERCHLFQVTAE